MLEPIALNTDNFTLILAKAKHKLSKAKTTGTSYAYVSQDFHEVWIDYEKQKFRDDYISKAPEGRLSCSIYLLFIEEALEEYMSS